MNSQNQHQPLQLLRIEFLSGPQDGLDVFVWSFNLEPVRYFSYNGEETTAYCAAYRYVLDLSSMKYVFAGYM